RMLLAGLALSTAFTMLLMMLQASGDPRMAPVLTWISGSTYNATDAPVWPTGIAMVLLLAITSLCRSWLTILLVSYSHLTLPPHYSVYFS
ncbi:iron chelate uptake ABC transporter family permease subunit, partial [Escherichia coli]|uniref:iron chelate uptake ABC transporter family permease subunit n=1 Tax=Escherichia coli TaxID=562 RepID=UPI001115A509